MAHVLLIEPDKLLARSYKAALSLAGHSVDWCADPQKAIHALDEKLVDIIILELHLAKHNGVEFLHELRSYPEWGNVPVILHTMLPVAVQTNGQSFWAHLGIAQHLYKPQTSLQDLIRSINRTLAVETA